jgi:ADP-ribose pyrophosphatase YjhB (NUDIX family)
VKKKISEMLKPLAQDPSRGLPEEIFLLVSSLTPLANVDLLIQDEGGRTLLTWRDDGYYPPGWHIPGGIIRYKERIETRIRAVAREELAVEVDFNPVPLVVHEIINSSRKERGHFISLLYRCHLRTPLADDHRFQPANPRADDWRWHDAFPENMIPPHNIYRPFFRGI